MAGCILVSACLLGFRSQWNARAEESIAPALSRFLNAGGKIVSICPECSGGLPTPRPPCEIQGGSGRDVIAGTAQVISAKGKNCTFEYLAGARDALALCLSNKVSVAILKSRSPSCSSSEIHDGTFSDGMIPGDGVTAALLKQSGIDVYDENHIIEALARAGRLAADGQCRFCGKSSCQCGGIL